jgi:ketosteroid isomerase-like protein
MTPAAVEVRQAAATLVDAFGRGDLEAYFDCFSEDATFLFHTTDRLLGSLEEYRQEWARWVRDDGFQVVGCTTAGTRVQDYGDLAVLTHEVRTAVTTHGGRSLLHERETIVFRRNGDRRWLAVHEHLSAFPSPVAPESGAA